MRLWHQDMIEVLPRQQLLGQHRECAALRGNGWAKSHETVNYIFDHNPVYLYYYHYLIIKEMVARGYTPDIKWLDPKYRGKNCNPHIHEIHPCVPDIIYKEHNDKYLLECLSNLHDKFTNAEEGKYDKQELRKFYEFYHKKMTRLSL